MTEEATGIAIESNDVRKGELRALVAEMIKEIGAKENNNEGKENSA